MYIYIYLNNIIFIVFSHSHETLVGVCTGLTRSRDYETNVRECVFSFISVGNYKFSAIQPTMKGYLLVKSWGCHGKSMGRSRIVVDQLVDLW